MCGGYTRICVHCGMCGRVDVRPIIESGICPVCNHENEPGALLCEACGFKLPKPPGSQMQFDPERLSAEISEELKEMEKCHD